jgi:hypothetical protein
MDNEVEVDELSDSYQSSSSVEHEYSGLKEEEWEVEGKRKEFIVVGIGRVPPSLLQNTAAALWRGRHVKHPHGTMVVRLTPAWMSAIAQMFPGTSVAKLRSTDPPLLPLWLLELCKNHLVRTRFLDLYFVYASRIVRPRLAFHSGPPEPNPGSGVAVSLLWKSDHGQQ